MSFINVFAIFVLFLLVGFVANLGKNKYVFIKASLLSTILILTSFIALIIGVVTITTLDAWVIEFDPGLFTYALIIILLSGIVEYFLIRFIINRHFNDDLLLTIVEYFIQWTLIYLTLYQFITQSITKSDLFVDIKSFLRILDINVLNITILPVMLISWISLTMTKINKLKED